MSQPTTQIGFSPTTPAAPSGDQNTIPQSDNATPFQTVSQYPQKATSSLRGTVKPDGTSTTVAGDGTLSATVTPSKIQQESLIYAADTGAANAYVVTLSPVPTIVTGSVVVFKATNANTGASTIAVNGGTATAIKKNGSTALAGAEINAGQIVEVVYDGTNYQLIGGSGATSPLTTKGDLFGHSTVDARIPVGTDGQVLTADSTQALGVKYATPPSATTTGGLIQLLQFAQASNGVVAFANANKAGSCILVEAISGSAATCTDSNGNTYSAFNVQTPSGGDTFTIFVALNVKAGANTVTIATGTGETTAIYEYSNVASVDAHVAASSASATSIGTGTATTTTPGDLIHLTGGWSSFAATTPSNTAGWPLIQTHHAFVDQLASFNITQATAGAISNTLTSGGTASEIYASLICLSPQSVSGLTASVAASLATKVDTLTTTGIGPATLTGTTLNVPTPSVSGGGLFTGITIPTVSNTGLSSQYGGSANFTSGNTAFGVSLADFGPAGNGIAGSGNVGGIVKAYSGVPFTATVLISIPASTKSFPTMGLLIANTLTTQAMAFQVQCAGGGLTVGVQSWTNPTTFGTNIVTATNLTGGRFIWLRIKDDGTNIFYSISSDGQFFQQIYTVAKSASFLGGSGFNFFGFYINPQQAIVGSTLMSWQLTTP